MGDLGYICHRVHYKGEMGRHVKKPFRCEIRLPLACILLYTERIVQGIRPGEMKLVAT